MNTRSPSWPEVLTNFISHNNNLAIDEQKYLSSWKQNNPTLKDIWSEMDKVWDEFALSNRVPLDKQNISSFYSHPVWILNGLFTGYDSDSIQHRKALSLKIIQLGTHEIADYGGGFGELARQITTLSKEISVDIIEPYPPPPLRNFTSVNKQTKIIPKLTKRYDLIVAQDVLEHIDDPLGLVYKMSRATVDNGYLIFANCFKPVIKCHLPATFHLRHTFNWVIEPLGLKYCGPVKGAEHAKIFQLKYNDSDLQILRKREYISKAMDPLLNLTCAFLRKLNHVGISQKI